jgi:hypothetical protein
VGVALTNRTTPKILPQLVHRVHSANRASTTEEICPSNVLINIHKHRTSPFDALSLSRHTTRRARAGGCSQVLRSAFLEGAREAGGTKTCTGAAAKQKTAEPQGAASLSLAVLESDGRKREGSSDKQCGPVGSRKARGKTRDGENVRAVPRLAVGKATGAYTRQSALGCSHSVATRGIAGREKRVGAATKRPQAWGPRKRSAKKAVGASSSSGFVVAILHSHYDISHIPLWRSSAFLNRVPDTDNE